MEFKIIDLLQNAAFGRASEIGIQDWGK